MRLAEESFWQTIRKRDEITSSLCSTGMGAVGWRVLCFVFKFFTNHLLPLRKTDLTLVGFFTLS